VIQDDHDLFSEIDSTIHGLACTTAPTARHRSKPKCQKT
jgi:hypothetical protein